MLQNFSGFGFGDRGANLSVMALLDRGERPSIDFGYQYGLLSMGLGWLWLKLFGVTPSAYLAWNVLCNLLLVLALARLAVALRFRGPGIALLVVALPFAVQINQPNFTHGLEAVFLGHALAEHARNRRGVALALLTAACLSKPALGYVYGLLLVGLILVDGWRTGKGWRGVVRELAPAAGTGVVLLGLLAGMFGVEPVGATVLPMSGAEAYRQMNLGFFSGIGRHFWAPPGAGPGYYFGTAAGFWLLSSLLVLFAGLGALWRWGRWALGVESRSETTQRDEMLATIAALHLSFVTALFGHQYTWVLYSYLLVLAAGMLSTLGRPGRWVVWGLVLLSAIGLKSTVSIGARHWRTFESEPLMAGLWAPDDARQEWTEVLRLSEGQKLVALAYAGGLPMLEIPGARFDEPIGYWFLPGIALPAEVERKAEQLARAPVVVLYRRYWTLDRYFETWPEFQNALRNHEVVLDGDAFTVLRRAD